MEICEVTVPGGQSIKENVTQYVLDHGWKDVYLCGAIGSVIDCSFTAPVENELPLRTGTTPCHGAAELVSLTGEIMAWERMDPALAAVYTDKTSPVFVHIHASVATAGGHVMGGGLTDGKAFRSVRVFLIPLDGAEQH